MFYFEKNVHWKPHQELRKHFWNHSIKLIGHSESSLLSLNILNKESFI